MITSEGIGGAFVIATPTKCGTTTLEEMCRRHRGGRAYPGLPSFRIMDWEQPRRQHRMALPAPTQGTDWDMADRYMMVRNPYLRYMSMYEYLRAPHNYSKFGAREVQGREWRGLAMGKSSLWAKMAPMRFEQFLFFIAESRLIYNNGRWAKRRGDLSQPFAYRSPWVWLDSLDVSRDLLRMQGRGREVGLIRLEEIWATLGLLKEQYQLRTLSVRPTIHANRTLTYMGNGGGKPGVGVAGREHNSDGIHAVAHAYWGSIKCTARLFRGSNGDAPDGVFRPERVLWVPGCECAACVVGVGKEAVALGYVQAAG